MNWSKHPGVRSDSDLTFGERAADAVRNQMGSWPFVGGFGVFMVLWMGLNTLQATNAIHFDKYPYILLNLMLSTLAGIQGAILLIAAKRADQVSSELAQHDYDADVASRDMLTTITTEFALFRQQHAQQTALLQQLLADRNTS